MSNISVHATTVSSHTGSPTFASELIKGKLTDMRLDTTIEAQTLSGIFSIEDIKFAEPKISTQSAILNLRCERVTKNMILISIK